MEAFIIQNMAPIMFGSLIVVLLLGYPAAFSLAFVGLFYALLGIGSFTAKVLFFCWFFMQIRWTLPRFRYDQLMRLGWLGLFPVAVMNPLDELLPSLRDTMLAMAGGDATRIQVLGPAKAALLPVRR